MKIPQVGQTVYALNIGNNARHQKQSLVPVKVVSVGRKYFKCQHGQSWWVEYRLENWLGRSDYSANFQAYETPEEWENEKDRERIIRLMRETFSVGLVKLSLEDLRAMESILKKIPNLTTFPTLPQME